MNSPEYEKIKPYLPSKKLARILGVTAVVVILLLTITSYFGNHLNFFSGKKSILSTETVGSTIDKDSNNNGIPDWEESLWGFDPNGDGAANKKAIEAKKQAASDAGASNGISQDDLTANTPTGAFSRDLLSSILALEQSGNLTPEAVANIATSIGQTIDAKRTPSPAYKLGDITLATGDLTTARKTYKKNFQVLLPRYKNSGLGSEFEVIAQGLSSDSDETTSLADLAPIGSAYTNFSKDILALQTPKDAAVYALELANASAEIADSLQKIQQFNTDVLTGMVGMDEYARASNSFTDASQNMGDYFGALAQ